MKQYKVYAKVYDTAADYRSGNYHYATVNVTAEDEKSAEAALSFIYFSAYLVSITEVK